MPYYWHPELDSETQRAHNKALKRFDKVNQRAWAHVRKHAQLNATHCEKSIIRIFDRMNFNTNEVLK
jgi:hypothetical protein